MAVHRSDLDSEIPEADLLDQHTSVEPEASTSLDLVASTMPNGRADEADVLEQSAPVPGDDDYPHDYADGPDA